MYRKQNQGIVTNFKSRGTYFFTRQHADACNSPKAPPSVWFKFKRFPKGVMMLLPIPALVLIRSLELVCSSNTHSSLQTPQGLHIQALQPLLYLSSMVQPSTYFPFVYVPVQWTSSPTWFTNSKANVLVLYIFAMSHKSNSIQYKIVFPYLI